MKTKKASKTNTRSRIIFFAIALTYNLLLGVYLKDFLVLSPMFTTFYILLVLPMLFLLVDTRYKILRAVIYILKFHMQPQKPIQNQLFKYEIKKWLTELILLFAMLKQKKEERGRQ